jgi:anaphase-promoting complex subunit 11
MEAIIYKKNTCDDKHTTDNINDFGKNKYTKEFVEDAGKNKYDCELSAADETDAFSDNVFTVKLFAPIATYGYNVTNTICAICRNDLMAPSKTQEASDDNHSVQGKCKHAFHSKCINKWLQQTKGQGVCPTCSTTWNRSDGAVLDPKTFSHFLQNLGKK